MCWATVGPRRRRPGGGEGARVREVAAARARPRVGQGVRLRVVRRPVQGDGAARVNGGRHRVDARGWRGVCRGCAHRHRRRRAAGRFSAVDDGSHPVGVGGGAQAGVRVVERVDALGFGDAVAMDRVGDIRSRGPGPCVHGSPGHDHLFLAGFGRHPRTGAELMAELVPGLVAVAVEVDRQGRVLRGGSKVPGVVGPAVAIDIQVPRPVDPAVASRPLQRGRGPPPCNAGGRRIPVARVDLVIAGPLILPDQAPPRCGRSC